MTKGIQPPAFLGRALRYRFHRQELLTEALTHASFANESGLSRCNERLEFLGDAVLELCVSERLYRERPDAEEGDLTRWRSALVCAPNLARWGRLWGIPACLLLGKGFRRGGPNENMVADAFEAVLGAIYLDGGLDAAREVLHPLPLPEVLEEGKDPKSRLQEVLQGQGHPCPRYELREQSGPPHERWFVVEVSCGEQVLASGEGRSLREAERCAANRALESMQPVALSGEEG